MPKFNPVLLCGGVGSRLWPVSREARPKQYLNLIGEQSMFQQTLGRLDGLPVATPMVVCNEQHRFLVAEQLRQLDIESPSIVLEPAGRNTAPAIAIAAIDALAKDPEAVLLVLPADHHIADVGALQSAVTQALNVVDEGRLITFGLIPNRLETGYGYIRCGKELSGSISDLAEFVEKPDAATAEAYLESGDYVWNSGMFMFRADAYCEALATHQPEMLKICREAMAAASTDMDFVRPDPELFASCPSDSIDYAVMEKTDRGAVVSLDCGWSDIGAWSALWEAGSSDADGNVTVGDVLLDNSRNSYVRSQSRLVTATGIDDLVIVETADAVMVADRHSVQDVKNIVNALKGLDRSEAHSHHRVFRPWGSYESLASADGFQVKRIIVNPGQRLSLQMHHHRAEHWVVVRGVAEVVNGEESFLLREDQSAYIPIGAKHRLSNPGAVPLELIEVQSGSYLGEDDIVRFEDVYGRSES
ncbi:MAG: mannose-1-phosphate guanylyltransferase/mannose-6-phosphate isomerase [Cellvibrionales bacterium TMED21]|nr:mannose-1-phosphate guanylyltransferase/mannose-6-phosphate isomerase [Halieaceae bacterium]OUT64670.1 MAG: mannose-1-phosphate guanylyltransferase/mannose-6-phosphate isomerase [Cellvibrionales bacterium TMED21]